MLTAALSQIEGFDSRKGIEKHSVHENATPVNSYVQAQ